MRKTHNKFGDAAFRINTTHIVTSVHFATALAYYYWDENIEFDPEIKKRDAFKILKNSLFYYGLQGKYDMSLYEGASAEAVEGFEKSYPKALEWVLENYPYLNENYYDNN